MLVQDKNVFKVKDVVNQNNEDVTYSEPIVKVLDDLYVIEIDISVVQETLIKSKNQ